jgi:hypothetical protein
MRASADARGPRRLVHDQFEQSDAADAGHAQVGHDDVEGLPGQQIQRLLAARGELQRPFSDQCVMLPSQSG